MDVCRLADAVEGMGLGTKEEGGMVETLTLSEGLLMVVHRA